MYKYSDPIIEKWAKERNLRISVEKSQAKRRYLFITNSEGFTFQIVVEPENEGITRVDLHLIEHSELEEVEANFFIVSKTSKLKTYLELFYKIIMSWV